MYEKSLAIEKALGLQEGMANQYGNLAIVYKTRGELDRARASWELAAELFETLGSPHVVTVLSWIAELDTQEIESI